jgi:hypothetical protein
MAASVKATANQLLDFHILAAPVQLTFAAVAALRNSNAVKTKATAAISHDGKKPAVRGILASFIAARFKGEGDDLIARRRAAQNQN